MQQRGIPAANLVLLDAPEAPDISWTEFVDRVFNPLRRQLTAAGWLKGLVTDQLDAEGRLRYVFYGHQIAFLVTCYGIPIRIVNDPARLARATSRPRPEFNTNQAAVDSELALLATLDTPTAGPVNNPLYGRLDPDDFIRGQIVRVARLDGPSAAAARGLVDSALAGEAHGLQGRAYLDFSGKDPLGDQWLAGDGQLLRQLGFDVSENHVPALIGWSERFDAPALYFGWWSWELSGPISDPDFRFPPGAIAIHIHSFSAEMIRDGTHRWVGPLVNRGVAATVGNVFEPYLQLTHNPQMFLDALVHGLTTGEAAFYSLPALSWQGVFIGDPLYRPFLNTLPAQLDRAARDPGPYAVYAVIRQMNLLQEQGRLNDALALGLNFQDAHPHPALALVLAQLQQKLGHSDDALRQLAWVTTVDPVPRDDLGLLAETARWANDQGDHSLALALYGHALLAPSATRDFKLAVLPEASAAAKQAGDSTLAARWEQDLATLSAPPPATPAAPVKP
jgi:uncharacterized protein (TIGR03790 family)